MQSCSKKTFQNWNWCKNSTAAATILLVCFRQMPSLGRICWSLTYDTMILKGNCETTETPSTSDRSPVLGSNPAPTLIYKPNNAPTPLSQLDIYVNSTRRISRRTITVNTGIEITCYKCITKKNYGGDFILSANIGFKYASPSPPPMFPCF